MANDVEITPRPNGPYLVKGPVRIVDAGGNEYETAGRAGEEAGEVMAVVQTAMLAGLPYASLRDAIFTRPTMAEGLNTLFADVRPRNDGSLDSDRLTAGA